ncbi:SCO family protein [Flavobacterium orientale]|uniref:Photosynthetic protein synthase II n=1 Tax=Flavobacterium orientale TaxID=1756020 RepID=A0A917DEH5_9FLAO|nr:SCO family protein [Flavobacterium orientale]GGD33617.1 photosynthetic protein synthase II [Flavobacterium orientale]
MKNKSYIGISFIILVFGIIFIPRIIDRISNNTIKESDRLNVSGQAETSKDLLQTIASVPKFSLTNQNGEIITNETLLGDVYVVEFFFSTCPTICPVMNQNMLLLQNHFKDHPNFSIISITINPEYDTKEVLKSHAEHLGVTSPKWHFLTGEKDYIYSIANKGFNLYAAENKTIEGGFEHSGFFALIDKNGKIRSRKDNSGNPIIYYSGLNYLDAEGFEEDFSGPYKPGIEALKQDIKVVLEEK